MNDIQLNELHFPREQMNALDLALLMHYASSSLPYSAANKDHQLHDLVLNAHAKLEATKLICLVTQAAPVAESSSAETATSATADPAVPATPAVPAMPTEFSYTLSDRGAIFVESLLGVALPTARIVWVPSLTRAEPSV